MPHGHFAAGQRLAKFIRHLLARPPQLILTRGGAGRVEGPLGTVGLRCAAQQEWRLGGCFGGRLGAVCGGGVSLPVGGVAVGGEPARGPAVHGLQQVGMFEPQLVAQRLPEQWVVDLPVLVGSLAGQERVGALQVLQLGPAVAVADQGVGQVGPDPVGHAGVQEERRVRAGCSASTSARQELGEHPVVGAGVVDRPAGASQEHRGHPSPAAHP